jgi:glucuronide carrier protein
LVYSAATFAQKAGFSLGGAIVMLIIAQFGFVANQSQTPEAITGIKLSLSIVPAAISGLGIILLFFYKLTDSQMEQIEKELQARKTESENLPH